MQKWSVKPSRPDNHWLDCLVGCGVAASMQGATLAGVEGKPVRKRRRLTIAEMREGV